MSDWGSFRTPLPTHTRTHAHPQCHTHTRTHARTHAHSHTHTHTHNYAFQAGSAWKGVCVRARGRERKSVRELMRRRELLREQNRKGKQELVRDRDRHRSRSDHKLVRGVYTHTWVIELNLCCFYFFVSNYPVALLEALLCARIVICRWAIEFVTCRWLV